MTGFEYRYVGYDYRYDYRYVSIPKNYTSHDSGPHMYLEPDDRTGI